MHTHIYIDRYIKSTYTAFYRLPAEESWVVAGYGPYFMINVSGSFPVARLEDYGKIEGLGSWEARAARA